MPIYEYQCRNCDHTFETLVFGKQEVTCPKCNSKNLNRLLSVFASKSDGKMFTGKSSCGSCNSGNCSSCGH